MGTCFRNCSCGCSQIHSDDEYGTEFFLGSTCIVGAYVNSAALRTALLQWCCHCRNFGASSTTSAGNGTSADDDNRMQVDSLKQGEERGKGKHQNQKGTRTSNTDVNMCKNCGRTEHSMMDGWRPGGGHTTIPTTQEKGRTTRKVRAKANSWTWCKRVSLPKQPQLCGIFHRHRARLKLLGAVQTQQRGWIMTLGGVTINSLFSCLTEFKHNTAKHTHTRKKVCSLSKGCQWRPW